MIDQKSDPGGPRETPEDRAVASAHSEAWTLVHGSGSEEDLREAVRGLTLHLRSHPDDSTACCLLSEAHLALGEADEALDAALAAVALAGPGDAEPYFRAGMALFDLAAIAEEGGAEDGGAEDGGAEDGGAEDGGAEDGGPEDARVQPALHFIEAALEIPPVRNPPLADEALRMFQEAEERDGDSSGPPLWAGLCLLNLGRLPEARDAFRAAAAREGTVEVLADAWFLHGLAAEELEEERQAAEAYRIALELLAGHRGARIRLRWIDPGERDRFLEPGQVLDLRHRIEAALSARGDPADACSGGPEIARQWAVEHEIPAADLESFLLYHGAACDCEVILNLEARLGLVPPGEAAGGECPQG